MIQTKLQTQYARRWFTQGPASACGHMTLNGCLSEGAALAEQVASPDFQTRWLDHLKAGDGFYAIVRQDSGTLWAATDRLRGMPLFYGQKGQDFFLSDEADWVRRQVGDREMDPLATAEFLQATYVTGPDTLFPHVKQVQAGESITARPGPGGWTVERTDYFRYRHGDYFTDSAQVLTEKLDAMYQRAIELLVQRAGGRTIVIPLTGGCDSRLIALMLHRLKYHPVICYTIGTSDYSDVLIARQVAAALGYPWRHVLYSGERWRRWYPSPQRRQYGRFAYNYTSLHHLLEWPGVFELHQEGYFPPDSIFVPGHTAIATCHTPPQLEVPGRISLDQVVQAIWEKKYDTQWASGVGSEYRGQLEQKIRSLIADLPVETAEEAASAFEHWEWRERQAKLQVNAVRVYEFFGYDWDLPLWGAGPTAFWMHMPLTLRHEKWFYKKYVCGLTGDQLPAPPGESWLRATIKRCVAAFGLARWGRVVRNARLRYKHPRASYAGIPDEDWKTVRGELYPDATYWTNEALKEMRQACQETLASAGAPAAPRGRP
jgi:asparagine synthase (glutamine-hydrolysing)